MGCVFKRNEWFFTGFLVFSRTVQGGVLAFVFTLPKHGVVCCVL